MYSLKIIKLYMNCGIIAVVMGIILSIIDNFLSTAQKHNRQNFEHNRPGLNQNSTLDEAIAELTEQVEWHK